MLMYNKVVKNVNQAIVKMYLHCVVHYDYCMYLISQLTREKSLYSQKLAHLAFDPLHTKSLTHLRRDLFPSHAL